MKEEQSRSDLELDYLKVIGDLRKFDATDGNHRNIIREYLVNAGYEEKKSGDDWIYFENRDLGMRAFFSNFPMNNKKVSKRPSLSLEFTGHYFIRINAYLTARKLIRFFSDNFGVFFKVSRVDIRQDIYNVKYPFDYFPDFQKEDNDLRWALRGKPSFNQYNNDFSDKATGFTIKTSRYTMMSYNRNIALEDRYRKGEISTTYFKYYKNRYGKRDVQRLEISLKQDACDFFAVLFFKGEYKEEKVLKMAMANFGRNHTLKKITKGMPLHKMPVDDVFSELFYLEEKDTVKLFKKEFELKAGLKVSEISFSEKGRSINEVIKMLAKKVCEHAEGDEKTRIDLLESTIELLRNKTKEFKDEFQNRVDRCVKCFSYMHFDLYQMIETNTKISNFYYQEAG